MASSIRFFILHAPSRQTEVGDSKRRKAVPANALLISAAVFLRFPNMIETNPIHAQIADLRGRVESLRGYL
ncbi:MAG: hypothetical protein ACYC0F_15350 [Rhodanobacter sp.]